MADAILWGIIQGLTEFLPVSSSGHLVLAPELLSELGLSVSAPSLAQSAFLHLGTLAAVMFFYRRDLTDLLRFRSLPPVEAHVGDAGGGNRPGGLGTGGGRLG